MRLVTGVFLALAFGLLGCGLAPEPERQRGLQDSVVYIIFPIADSYCGGVFLSHEFILTAKHCIEEKEEETLAFKTVGELVEGEPHPAKIVMRFPDRDLAVLQASAPVPHAKPVFLRCSASVFGEEIFLLGHPYDSPFVLSKGIFGGYNPESPYQRFLSAPVRPGHSGGGVFSRDGLLIGILTGAFYRQTSPFTVDYYNLGSVVEVHEVCDKLSRFLVPRDPSEYIQ